MIRAPTRPATMVRTTPTAIDTGTKIANTTPMVVTRPRSPLRIPSSIDICSSNGPACDITASSVTSRNTPKRGHRYGARKRIMVKRRWS